MDVLIPLELSALHDDHKQIFYSINLLHPMVEYHS